jgi:hypothetical protein
MADGNRAGARDHLSKSILQRWQACRLAYRFERVERLFPIRLARWLASHAELVDALVALRERDVTAAAELARLPEVTRFRSSWEAWLDLVDDAECAAELLLAVVPAATLARAISALWGLTLNPDKISFKATVVASNGIVVKKLHIDS